MEIKIPASFDDWNVRQVSKVIDHLTVEHDPEKHILIQICELISCVTGQKVEQLLRCEVKALKQAYKLIHDQLPSKFSKPPKYVTIENQKYFFNQDIGSLDWSAMRFMDADNNSIDVSTKPERLAAICYIEDGKKYGYPPEEGGCMDLDKRAQIMLKHFKGSDFFNLQAFFLRKYDQLQPGFLLLQIAKAQHLRNKAAKTMREGGSTV